MTQMSSTTPSGSARPRSNIYTVLLLVATVALAFGAGYMYVKNTSLTGEGNPFAIVEPTDG